MRSMPVVISGVVTGVAHGTAKARNEKIAPLLYARLPELKGFDLGTLNVQALSPRGLKIAKLSSPDQSVVRVPRTEYEWRKRPLRAETIAFVPVKFTVEGKVKRLGGYLYLPSRSSRPRRGILEIMSRDNLKQTYGVKEGDVVVIELA